MLTANQFEPLNAEIPDVNDVESFPRLPSKAQSEPGSKGKAAKGKSQESPKKKSSSSFIKAVVQTRFLASDSDSSGSEEVDTPSTPEEDHHGDSAEEPEANDAPVKDLDQDQESESNPQTEILTPGKDAHPDVSSPAPKLKEQEKQSRFSSDIPYSFLKTYGEDFPEGIPVTQIRHATIWPILSKGDKAQSLLMDMSGGTPLLHDLVALAIAERNWIHKEVLALVNRSVTIVLKAHMPDLSDKGLWDNTKWAHRWDTWKGILELTILAIIQVPMRSKTPIKKD